MTMNILDIENERYRWSLETFPEATSLGSLCKLKENINNGIKVL